MDVWAEVAAFAGGVLLVAVALDSAVRTFVLPRGVYVPFTRLVSLAVRMLFNLRVRFSRTYESRDRVMALYAPVALFTLVAAWLLMVIAGFMLMFWALGGVGWREAFMESGSSIFTLGFSRPSGLPGTVMAFAGAAIGLALLALLISYLPTIYGAFSRREVQVAHLSARSSTPPSAVDLIVRAHRIAELDNLDDLWISWQLWFAELEETHTSLAFLNFFRSPHADRSWITASGATLDTASIVLSTVDVRWQPMAALCIRSGYTALRTIADFFQIPHDADPGSDDPITIARDEFDEVCRQLGDAGVPLKADREQAWRDFRGWRVNYDTVVIRLAGLIMAPYASWSSDRSVYFRPRLTLRRRR